MRERKCRKLFLKKYFVARIRIRPERIHIHIRNPSCEMQSRCISIGSHHDEIRGYVGNSPGFLRAHPSVQIADEGACSI